MTPKRAEKTIAVIAARGGSKGVPRKNVRPLAGMPLIGYAIRAARGATLVDDVVVTTDDEEIATIARNFGARVPFMRTAGLSGDAVPMEPVLKDCIERVEREGTSIGAVALLPATNPFRTAADIDAGLKTLFDTGADSVVAVVEEHYPAAWLQTIIDGRLRPLLSDQAIVTRRQDAPRAYKRNDGFFIFRRDLLMRDGTLVGPTARPYVMEPWASIDIDSEWEFELAELIMSSPRGQHLRTA